MVGAAIAPFSKKLAVNAFVVTYWPVSLESRLFKLVTLESLFRNSSTIWNEKLLYAF